MAPKRKVRESKKAAAEHEEPSAKRPSSGQSEQAMEVAEEEQPRVSVEAPPSALAAPIGGGQPAAAFKKYVSASSIISSSVASIANDYWASPHSGEDLEYFSTDLLHDVFQSILCGGERSRVQQLELSGYLENFLWPYYRAANLEHTLSVLLLINEKLSQDSSAFRLLTSSEEKLQTFLDHLVDLFLSQELDARFLVEFLKLVVNAFRSSECEVTRKCTFRFVALPIWQHLSSARLRRELSMNATLETNYRKLTERRQTLEAKLQVASSSQPAKGGRRKKGAAEPAADGPDPKVKSVLESMSRDANFVPAVVDRVLGSMEVENPSKDQAMVTDLLLDLLVELLSQHATRRYVSVLLEDKHFSLVCRRSLLSKATASPAARKTRKFLQRLEDMLSFEIDGRSSKPLSKQDLQERCNARIASLQQLAFAHYPEKLRGLAFCSMCELTKHSVLSKHCALLTKEELLHIVKTLGLYHDKDEQLWGQEGERVDEDFLKELLFEYVSMRPLLVERINKLPLYPTEALLWDEDFLPSNSLPDGAVALPKLNVQFLSIHDYFMRNFLLFLMESSFAVRNDLMDAIKRMGPRQLPLMPTVSFSGWARMALPIVSVTLDEVAKPLIGELVPRSVTCSVTIDLARFTGDMRQEWEGLREHDVVFLACIERPLVDVSANASEFDKGKQNVGRGKKSKASLFVSDEEIKAFAAQYGIKHVRGGVVFEHKDEANNILNDLSRTEGKVITPLGTKRTLRLHLDPEQYTSDLQNGCNCYETFNLLIRRNAKENNFKSVLQTIRGLLNSATVGNAIPAWLHDVLLGIGSSNSAHYRTLSGIDSSIARGETAVETIHFQDTFLDADHIRESFPDAQIEMAEPSPQSESFELQITHRPSASGELESVRATSSPPIPRGPYEEDLPLRNPVRFTATQVRAIQSGTSEGLTVIVGPPGTGKTDCAVQIISNLYHNHPAQKILVVTHSNAALNDLFEKILQRDIDPRHLLRLGSGEADLRENLLAGSGMSVDSVMFSKMGRVEWCLKRRLQLLAQVQRLAKSMLVPGDFGSNCETSDYFYKVHVLPRMETFQAKVQTDKSCVAQQFPFGAFFGDTSQPLFFDGQDDDARLAVAEGCFHHLRRIFAELADYRALEILRTQALRSDYLLTKQARIVAMTCTHAAMTRSRLVELGFKYDSVIIEEAAQILEVETVIPLLLQDLDPVTRASRLKRVVLLGDAHQLPPIVQHQVLAKVSNLEQSMFSRLLRFGVPHITLDLQGRARPTLASLYAWRYSFSSPSGDRELGTLPSLLSQPQYLAANAGFVHPFQFVDVGEFKGKGETCPTPFFYQNLAEAEYVVATFQYMRLLGYPANKISIITTYNGQKHLIRDILHQRCRQSSLFGVPAQVTTVDKYQGQQNDYVLLSLVRTESVGHVRDVRRLIVALSRARLGLYVFGRLSLFENCYELLPAINRLKQKPAALQLVAGEAFPTSRGEDETVAAESVLEVSDVIAMGVLVYQLVQQAQHITAAAQDDSIAQ